MEEPDRSLMALRKELITVALFGPVRKGCRGN